MSTDLAEVQARRVEAARTKARALLGDALDSGDLGLRVEKAVWNWNIDRAEAENTKRIWFVYPFRMWYFSRVRTLLFNIRHPANQTLKADVRSSRISPQELVGRTPAQLFPSGPSREAEIALKHRDEVKEGPVPEGLLTCGRCKSRRVLWLSLQTRRADEPMTIYAYCSNCRKRFRTT